MAVVHIPALLRPLTGGLERCEVAAGSVRELIFQLDALHPGVRERLLEGDALRSGLSVFVDGTARREGLDYELEPDSEVHFVPAIAGGIGISRRPDTGEEF
jgi:molybdopterin synthase sulfur carrier subunit